MKKFIKVSLTILIIIIIFILCLINVNTNFAKSATLKYTFGEGQEAEVVDEVDVETLNSILNGKATIGGGYSCGFGGLEITMKSGFRRLTFILASDSCNIIYIPSKKLYLEISKEDREIINEIFKKYGLPFSAI